jgi:hypothetical protein
MRASGKKLEHESGKKASMWGGGGRNNKLSHTGSISMIQRKKLKEKTLELSMQFIYSNFELLHSSVSVTDAFLIY